MVSIRIASDLHLESYRGMDMNKLIGRILPEDSRDSQSILVLAGDISSDPDQLIVFLKTITPRFLNVIYIPGNHEWYRHEYHTWNTHMEEELKKIPNLVFAIGKVGHWDYEHVRFIFGTLWGDGGKSLEEQIRVGFGMNDFRVIGYGNDRFRVKDMMKLHTEQKESIHSALKQPWDGKKVVITHHLPSYRLCHPRFGSVYDSINGGFAGDCDDILAYDYAPDIWFHGHTHDSSDGMLWKTRIIANPLGYPSEFSPNSEYNNYCNKFIEI